MPDAPCVLVLTTIDLTTRADELARTLVEERLAACVNLLPPMRSTYTWKGEVCCDEERQVLMKTTRAALPALESRLRQLHPYELPELIVIPIEGSAAYLDWVRAGVGGELNE